MKLSVYLSKDFRYVVVPDCLLPSTECAQLFGPLDLCGQVTATDALEIGEWNRVKAQIERHDYARIGPKLARRLLGPRHRWLPPAGRLEDCDAAAASGMAGVAGSW